MKNKRSLLKDKRGQTGTVMTVVTGGIIVLIGVIIFASVYSALPKVGPSVVNESWAFNSSVSGTYAKTLANANLIEKPSDTVKVYNATWTGTKDTDYSVNYEAGTVTNITEMYTGTYGVDYGYEETGTVTTKNTVRNIFYSSVGLVIIGFLILAAVFILSIVSRLRGAGGGE